RTAAAITPTWTIRPRPCTQTLSGKHSTVSHHRFGGRPAKYVLRLPNDLAYNDRATTGVPRSPATRSAVGQGVDQGEQAGCRGPGAGLSVVACPL
ncbi:MAG: hypothetical protein ABW215_17115, partial [Kibdelosporangium sp.]